MTPPKRLVALLAAAFVVAIVQMPQVLSGKPAPGVQTKAPTAKPSAAAPDLSKMPRMSVTMVQIKPELLPEWQEFEKSEAIPALQKAGVKQVTVFATVYGQAFEYGILRPITNFAERDGESPFVKALGQEGARSLSQKARRFIAGERSYVALLRTDLSYHPEPDAALPVVVVLNYSIAPGRAADFENYIRTDLTAAHKQVGTAGFTVYQGIFGGDGNTFIVGVLLHNFAELDKGPAVLRAYGPARADAIQQKLAGIVAHLERTVVREVPELGFRVRAVTEAR
jgi:hypothetical protein